LFLDTITHPQPEDKTDKGKLQMWSSNRPKALTKQLEGLPKKRDRKQTQIFCLMKVRKDQESVKNYKIFSNVFDK